MFDKLFSTLGWFLRLLLGIALTTLLGLMTWTSWDYYQENRVQSRFDQEGKLLPLRIQAIARDRRSWRDQISNVVYLTTSYNGRPYTTRYVIDSVYVSEGDRVSLLYHPAYDQFRQPGRDTPVRKTVVKSRLIDWSAVSLFNGGNKLLFLCLALTMAFFFVASGTLQTMLPIPFLQRITGLVLFVVLLAATLFFTYDSYAYFQYYDRIKTNGHVVTVLVLDTDRYSAFSQTRRRSYSTWYFYKATIQYRRQQYQIPISEDDYGRFNAGSSLVTIYDESANDLMAADFPPDYWHLITPVFFGLLTFFVIRSGFGRQRQLSG